MAGLGDVGHSHPLVTPIDMEMQSPRAVEPQSQDGAFRTRVQIWPKLLTDLGGRDLLSSQRADSQQQQPPAPFPLLQVASPRAWGLYPRFNDLDSTSPSPHCNILTVTSIGGSKPETVQITILVPSCESTHYSAPSYL